MNPGRAEREGSSIDVLLVEDNAADALLIQDMLESSGLKLNPVPRLSSALDALEDRAFEAVLLDLGLPDSQGLETLARLRTVSRDAPIIVASGLDDEALALRAVELGAQDYIIKGRFDGERLERALRYAVARARVERLVRENAQQYGGLFDANPHPMWVVDADHLTFLAVNEAAIRAYGWSREEFLSMSADALVPEPERQRFRQTLAAARSEGEPQVLGVDGTCRHLARGGAVLEVELTVSAIPFRGRPAYLGISTDVTENRRLQSELVQANKMRALGQLAGGVAHDFNNALGIITGYAELAARDPRADPATRERVERILQAARQSAGLTRQLLAFSRRQVLESRVIDLNALVKELGGMLPGLIGGRADVTISTREGLSPVRADRVQLQQVMLNLVINARDAMPRGGTIAIETFDAGVRSQRGGEPRAFVGLRVRDDGEGMDAQTAARVFEPFFTTKGEGQGTGLGLATVYGIVRQSGGSIEVESEPGRGTTFRVYLPAVEAAVDDHVSPDGETAPVPGGRETVLLVEDSESLRDMVAEMLESAGYEVLEVPGPEAAIEQSRAFEGAIDLLLTDMMMPAMNGRELAARLAELRPGIPVLFMSGYSSELLDGQGQPIPGVSLLQKPFTARELLQRVREALGRSKP